MSSLYVVEQGAVIRKTGGRVLVEKDDKVLLDVPCGKLDTICLFGRVHITTPALFELLDRGIELALFTRFGRLRGQLTPARPRNITLRLAQYERCRDAGFRLGAARAIIAAKIANAACVVRQRRSNYSEPDLAKAERQLEQMKERAASATAESELLGLEGNAARIYFQALGRLNRSECEFEGRRRRPAPDPLNALLSFGYSIALHQLQALLDGRGLDPYLGLLHHPEDARPALALDMLEEFRHALADRLALDLLNLRILGPDDFLRPIAPASGEEEGEAGAPERRGLWLRPQALSRYFTEWEKRMRGGEERAGFREMFRRQVERMAVTMQDGAPYIPYLLDEEAPPREQGNVSAGQL